MKPHYLFLLLLPLFSCQKEGIAHFEKSDFENNRWYKTQPITLTFENKTPQKASIYFNLGYVYGSQFAEIPLEIYITNPLHQIDKIPVTLRLFNKDKKELGDCMGDFCDITQLLAENYTFDEIGRYKIQILNTFSHAYLPNVNSVAVHVN